jgi:hypothetical protein
LSLAVSSPSCYGMRWTMFYSVSDARNCTSSEEEIEESTSY